MGVFSGSTVIDDRASHLAMVTAVFMMSMPVSGTAMEWVGTTLDGVVCTGKGQSFGPYDFFDIDEPSDRLYQQGRHWEIKKLHRDRGVWAMQQVDPIDYQHYRIAAAELDYTLRAIPNEPYALQYRIELELMRRKNPGQLHSEYPPPECYLQRAIAFRPKQEHLRILYGIYFNKINMPEREVEQYESAIAINPNSAEAHYNLALALIRDERPGDAVDHAKQAYALGFPLMGAKRKLERLGFSLD